MFETLSKRYSNHNIRAHLYKYTINNVAIQPSRLPSYQPLNHCSYKPFWRAYSEAAVVSPTAPHLDAIYTYMFH